MAVELPILSFICAALLAVFIPTQRIRISVPRLAIILWLVGYNLVHGINALIWSGNVDIHVPVWCDIVTNFMLGVNLALPAAFLCISRELELLSSMRTVPYHPKVVLMLDIFMCYLLPILYILLHLAVQDHRFDLVENLGCSASTDPSAVGLSLMWIPPLLTCSITIVFFALSIHNSFRHPSDRFTIHLESRSTMNSSSFFRCLVISMGTTIAGALVYLFSSFYGPAVHPWSWTAIRASMFKVNIVSSQSDEIGPIQLAWWGGFFISMFYLLLSICLGEETRDILEWIGKQATPKRRSVLPVHVSTNVPTRLSTFEFKSGWDDMLDDKVPNAKNSAGKTLATTLTILTTCPSRSSIPSISPVTEDEAFTASTLSYLGSPTAKTLGLSESHVTRNAFEIPPKPGIPPPLPPIVLKVTESPAFQSPMCYVHKKDTFGDSLYPTLTPPLLECSTGSPTVSPNKPVPLHMNNR